MVHDAAGRAEDGKRVRLTFRCDGTKATGTFRILRRKAPKFAFHGEYGRKYLLAMEPDAAKEVHRGRLTAREGVFAWVDEDVGVRDTCAYWVAADGRADLAGPLCVRVRDPELWWPREKVAARMKALAKKHPKRVELETFGRTVGGWPLRGLLVGNRDRRVGLVGAVHAGESGPEIILLALEKLLAEHADLLDKVGVAALPTVNADERERLVEGCPWYLRKNANGVDLNRNFDADWHRVHHAYGVRTDEPKKGTYRGPKPGSEPETRAVVRFVEKTSPQVVFSYHHLGSLTGNRLQTVGKPAPVHHRFARPYVTGYNRRGGGKAAATDIPGMLSLWLWQKYGIPGYDVEKGSGGREVDRATHDRATAADLRTNAGKHTRAILAVLEALAETKD